MNPYEVEARFAHARAAGKITGCAPTKGKTTMTWPLKALEQVLVYDGIPVGISRTGVGYEVQQRIANDVVYRKIKKVAATR